MTHSRASPLLRRWSDAQKHLLKISETPLWQKIAQKCVPSNKTRNCNVYYITYPCKTHDTSVTRQKQKAHLVSSVQQYFYTPRAQESRTTSHTNCRCHCYAICYRYKNILFSLVPQYKVTDSDHQSSLCDDANGGSEKKKPEATSLQYDDG